MTGALLLAFLIFLAAVGLVVWAFFCFDRWLHERDGWPK